MLDEGRSKRHEGTDCRCIYYQIEAQCGTTNLLLIEERKEGSKGEMERREGGTKDEGKEGRSKKNQNCLWFNDSPLPFYTTAFSPTP